MLALMIVGSYLIVLVLGSGTPALDEHYTEVLAACRICDSDLVLWS